VEPETVSPRWTECIVAATGPSLSEEVAELCRGHNVIAVNDAHRRLPFADVLYACDAPWWKFHKGCPEFKGEKWSSHNVDQNVRDDKSECARLYGIRIVKGRNADGFSLDPDVIHYGSNSGFQAINLAIHFGCKKIVLVGFDMSGKSHFFGDHPAQLNRSTRYERYITYYEKAAQLMPKHINIVNANEGSALECFPKMPLHECLNEAHSVR
jgi:hypothetical protein